MEKNATTVMRISVEAATAVRNVAKETAGAITVATVVTALKLFVIAETVVVIAPMYALVAKRNVATAPVIYVHIVVYAKPASVTAVGAIAVMYAVTV